MNHNAPKLAILIGIPAMYAGLYLMFAAVV